MCLKRGEMSVDWRKLHSNEFCNVYVSLTTLGVVG
jgi:hypothetical protein